MLDALIAFVRALVRSLAQPGQLVRGLREILRAVCPAVRRLLALGLRGDGRDGDCCLKLDDTYKRPDPLIYAQYYLMSMGLAVTWDNPDIDVFEPGAAGPHAIGAHVPSSSLQQDHVYRVRIRVWNGSYDAPAVGLPVDLSYLSFGAGMLSHPVGSDFINLGVKGSPQQPAFAFIDWRTPATAGHYCLQARLDWPDDANPNNNLGQENVEVGVAQSPAVSRFTLRNEATVERRFVFEADAYRPPPPPPCSDTDQDRPSTRLAESRARWERARREHDVHAFPIPDSWTITIEPADVFLRPGQEHEITVSIEPPTGTAQTPVNVNAFAVEDHGDGRAFVGGVTLYTERS